MRWPKCNGEEKTKNGFKNGIQRYKCKTYGCNYAKSTPHGYPIEVKREALRYYLEGIGFRRIERYSFWRKKRREGRRSRAWRNVRKLKKIEQKPDYGWQ